MFFYNIILSLLSYLNFQYNITIVSNYKQINILFRLSLFQLLKFTDKEILKLSKIFNSLKSDLDKYNFEVAVLTINIIEILRYLEVDHSIFIEIVFSIFDKRNSGNKY